MKISHLNYFFAVVSVLFSVSCEVEKIDTSVDSVDAKSIENKGAKLLIATTVPINIVKHSKLTTYWMRKDHEPNHRGGAEIYAFILGLNIDKDLIVQKVRLPSLNYDRRTYYPNKTLINWDGLYYGAVSIVFMEADNEIPGFTEPIFSNTWEPGQFRNTSVIDVLKIYANNFRTITVNGENIISPSDDHVDTFELIERNKPYTVYPGKKDNVYLSLEKVY